MGSFERLTLAEHTTVEKAVGELNLSESVEYAQPNYLLYSLPISEGTVQSVLARSGSRGPCLLPGSRIPFGCDEAEYGDGTGSLGESDRPALKVAPQAKFPPVVDPDLSQLWGMRKVQALEAWKIQPGSRQVIVADIDTGIDYNHVDLAFNIWRNPNPTEKNDRVGFDFVHNDGLPFDDQEHGTHTAGTVGAVGGNGVGISGVSQVVALMALKFLAKDGSGTTADAIRAIDYAIAHGAQVLSNSWGGQGDSDNRALREAITRAQVKGVLFVAAAGNNSADNDVQGSASYPAAFQNDNLISVAATDEDDNLTYFSNYGKRTTHLAAPGSRIYSTIPGDQYKQMSGTSMACPHVAGAAALLWSQHPDWDYHKVKQVLLSTVDVIPGLSGKLVSGGRLNVFKALQYADAQD
jgi:subtilisin family serine protease